MSLGYYAILLAGWFILRIFCLSIYFPDSRISVAAIPEVRIIFVFNILIK